MTILIPPTSQERAAAAPYRGQTLRVKRVPLDDLNAIAELKFSEGFALHPQLGVKAVDQAGRRLKVGELVLIKES